MILNGKFLLKFLLKFFFTFLLKFLIELSELNKIYWDNNLRLTYWRSAAVPAPAQYILEDKGSIFSQFLSATIEPAVAFD